MSRLGLPFDTIRAQADVLLQVSVHVETTIHEDPTPEVSYWASLQEEYTRAIPERLELLDDIMKMDTLE